MTDKLDHSLDPMWDKLKADGEKLGLDYGQKPPKTAKQINTEAGVGEGRVVLAEIVEKQLAKELYDKIRTEVANEIFYEIDRHFEVQPVYLYLKNPTWRELKEKYGINT